MERRTIPLMPGTAIPSGVKLIFELTNRCNFSCVHCIRSEDGPHHDLPVTIVDKVLREVQNYQPIRLVAFTGGEPTLHPQFADIVELVTGAQYPYTFVTNGWNFPQTFEKILAWKHAFESVSFSVDGASETTHDTLRRQPKGMAFLSTSTWWSHVRIATNWKLWRFWPAAWAARRSAMATVSLPPRPSPLISC